MDNHNLPTMQTLSREVFSSGVNLLQLNRISPALFHFRKALLLDPSFNESKLHLAHCLHLEEKYGEAVALYDQLISESWNLDLVLNNRGNTLLKMRRCEEAIESYKRALEIAPDIHDARVAMASCLQATGKLDEAMAACDRVLSIAPENAEAHWNRALLLLLMGNYREGWKEYEWRWYKKGFTSPRRDFPQPRWNGEPLANRSILIHAEQGFGDTIQFFRYLPLLADSGANIILECHPPLARLLRNSDRRISVVAMGNPLPHFDVHLPLLSLPLTYGTTVETVPLNIPYIKPSVTSPDLNHIFDSKCFKVGICWSGKSYPDPGRSCPAELLAPLGDVDNIAWYSLQIPLHENLSFPIIDLAPFIRDFNDTAMLMEHLDLVLTIDTAVAHLAGAMGKPAWVMLPKAPDWRWMLEKSDSPWYPTMKLFRQKQAGGYEPVIQEVISALKNHIQASIN